MWITIFDREQTSKHDLKDFQQITYRAIQYPESNMDFMFKLYNM